MTIHRLMLAAAVLTLAACGRAKAPVADSAVAGSSTAVPAMPPSQVPAPDTMQADAAKHATADSSTKPAAKPAPPAVKPIGDYDRALKPKFSVDEKTGKVTPLKKP